MPHLYWSSNAPHAPSGYGTQTDTFTRLALSAGYDVTVRANFGVYATTMVDLERRLILPATNHQACDDVIWMDWERFSPDVGVVLYDSWVMSDYTSNTPIAFWAPIDHATIPPSVRKRLSKAKFVWAMSRHGEREMRKVGIDPFYVPHGIDTENTWKPIDRNYARKLLGVDKDKFIAVTVAANKGYPDRKNLRGMVKAWGAFVKARPDSLFYVHTLSTENHGGVDMERLREFYGISPEQMMFPDVYDYISGMIKEHHLNLWYNAADVFLLPSMGEGFGIPAIEAQAAGCPVIVSDFSAQSELCGAGWKIPVDEMDLVFTSQNAEQCLINPRDIVKHLELAYGVRGAQRLRDEARQFALQYDAKRVWADYMHPALQQMQGIIAREKATA